jgi:hypothetical protein
MTPKPAILFGLVGVQFIEDDADLAAGMGLHNPVHEVQELDPAAPFVMPARYLAGRDIEGRKQGRGSMPFVIVALARQRASIGELEIALLALQGLDGGLFVNSENERPLDAKRGQGLRQSL